MLLSNFSFAIVLSGFETSESRRHKLKLRKTLISVSEKMLSKKHKFLKQKPRRFKCTIVFVSFFVNEKRKV